MGQIDCTPGAAHDSLREDAAFQVLGILDRKASAVLGKRIESGCRVCQTEVAEAETMFAAVVRSLPPVTPPPSLRNRLLNRVKGADSPASPYGGAMGLDSLILAHEGNWTPVCEGVHRKSLHYDKTQNSATFLLKLDPGAILPAHSHGGTEQCLVLQGEIEDGDLTLRQGDFQTLKSGSVHPASRTKQGCLLLIVAAEPSATRFV